MRNGFDRSGSEQLFVEVIKRAAERRDVIAPRVLKKAVFFGREYVGHQRPGWPVLEQPAFVTDARSDAEPTRGRHVAEAGNDFLDALHIALTVRRLVRRRNIVRKEFCPLSRLRIRKAAAAQREMVLRFDDGIAARGQSEFPYKVENVLLRRQEAHAAGFTDQMRRLWKRNGAQSPADPVAHLEEGDAQAGLLACEPPGRVRARDAAADDRDIDIGIRARTYRQRQRRQRRRARKHVSPRDIHWLPRDSRPPRPESLNCH